MEQVVAAIQQGDLNVARARLNALLRTDANHVEALRLLGKLDLHQGQPESAAQNLRRAAQLAPGSAEISFEAAVALMEGQHFDAATGFLQTALSLDPDHDGATFNMAWVLRRQGQADQAAAHLERLARRRPDHVDCWFNLGNVYLELGRPGDAVRAFSSVLKLAPAHWQAAVNMADALRQDGAVDRAETLLRSFADTAPEAANSLGTLLTEQGRRDEALAVFDAALARSPHHLVLGLNRALALLVWAPRRALVDFLALTARHPQLAEAWNGLGSAHLACDSYAEAEAAFRHAVAIRDDYAESWGNLGKVQALLGRPREALISMRRAIAAAPQRFEIQSNLLFLLRHVDDLSAEQVFAEHVRFGQTLESHLPPLPPRSSAQSESERRLRIGYVSPDFREHAVSLFFLPVLEGHDRSQVEVFCYHASQHDDAITKQIRQLADHWRPIGRMSTMAAAKLIDEDGIDILVDLAGHTAGNRLDIFACKPAPIQATWLGYPGTTGLSRMDYRLTDGGADCPGGENQKVHTEKLEYLPVSACFRPPADCPPVSSAAFARHGRIRFGSFNKLGKASETVLRTWSAILRALPQAELLMIVPGGEESDTRHKLTDGFAAHGIAPERLQIHGLMNLTDFLTMVGEVDVALDTFPYGGGTTSLLTLWMGVPLISMEGNNAGSATGPTLLRELGLHDLVAKDETAYVNAAIAATAPDHLRYWRESLRPALAKSSVFQESAFVKSLEQAYRRWWWHHLALNGKRSGSAALPAAPFGLALDSRNRPQDSPIPLADNTGHVLLPFGQVRWDAATDGSLVISAGSYLEAPQLTGNIIGSGDFVAECRVMVDEASLSLNTSGIMLLGQHGQDRGSWGLVLSGPTGLCGWLSPNGLHGHDPQLVRADIAQTGIAPGRWHHLALIRRGDSLQVTVDGHGPSVFCPPGVPPAQTGEPLRIGGNPHGLTARGNIRLDNIRVIPTPSIMEPT